MRDVQVGGKTVTIEIESGAVVGLQTESTTHVYGNAQYISSSVTKSTEYGLVGSDGIERPHYLSGSNVFLRNGHVVSLLYACFDDRLLCYIVNHSTRRHDFIRSNPRDVPFELGLLKRIGCLWYLLWWIGCGAIAAAIGEPNTDGDPPDALVWAMLGGFVFLWAYSQIQKRRAKGIWRDRLAPAFEQTAKALLARNIESP